MTLHRNTRMCGGAIALMVLAGLSGCATQFMGSAASPIQGRAYVVGHQGNFAGVWLCPTDRVQGECQIVRVEEM
jgi:hypothetical protein